jgi:hypothetical protein
MPPSGTAALAAIARLDAAIRNNQVHVTRGKDTQAVTIGANGQAATSGGVGNLFGTAPQGAPGAAAPAPVSN